MPHQEETDDVVPDHIVIATSEMPVTILDMWLLGHRHWPELFPLTTDREQLPLSE